MPVGFIVFRFATKHAGQGNPGLDEKRFGSVKNMLKKMPNPMGTLCRGNSPPPWTSEQSVTADLPLKAVVFDCDGVLVDTEPLHYQAFQEILQPLDLGFDYDHYLKHYIGFDDRDAFIEAFREGNRPLDAETLHSLIEAKGNALLRIIANGVSSFPGVTALVHELAAGGIPLAVASGALRHEVELFLKVLGLEDAFSVIVAADDVSRSKPDPETYLAALKRLQTGLGSNHADPTRCIAIEDTPTGIQSAKAAGLFVIGVTNSFPAQEIREVADLVVQSLEEITLEKMLHLMTEGSRSPSHPQESVDDIPTTHGRVNPAEV